MSVVDILCRHTTNNTRVLSHPPAPTHAHMHVHTYTCTHTYTETCACLCTCAHTHTYTETHTHTHTHTHHTHAHTANHVTFDNLFNEWGVWIVSWLVFSTIDWLQIIIYILFSWSQRWGKCLERVCKRLSGFQWDGTKNPKLGHVFACTPVYEACHVSQQVKVQADLPVGENLMDHPLFSLPISINTSITLTEGRMTSVWELAKYLTVGKGQNCTFSFWQCLLLCLSVLLNFFLLTSFSKGWWLWCCCCCSSSFSSLTLLSSTSSLPSASSSVSLYSLSSSSFFCFLKIVVFFSSVFTFILMGIFVELLRQSSTPGTLGGLCTSDIFAQSLFYFYVFGRRWSSMSSSSFLSSSSSFCLFKMVVFFLCVFTFCFLLLLSVSSKWLSSFYVFSHSVFFFFFLSLQNGCLLFMCFHILSSSSSFCLFKMVVFFLCVFTFIFMVILVVLLGQNSSSKTLGGLCTGFILFLCSWEEGRDHLRGNHI